MGSFLDYLRTVPLVLIMCRLFERLAGITAILFALLSSAQGQLREQRPLLDWRTFVVPDFGTRIQYPASIFAPFRPGAQSDPLL
jgi:hypothetical protein